MGIAKSLTNDLERAVKLYRVPVLTALGLSLRSATEDRFLVTDPRGEDVRRNVIKLARVVKNERQMTKLDVGVDSRQFIDMGGLLLFDGVKAASGRIVPVPNVSASGGLADVDGVHFTATGTAEEKSAKIKRYVLRRPEQVTWRVRTPVMMAGETSVLDYLALRVSQLQFLQSVAIKWSDRRWDARSCPLAGDMFRPEGERTQQIVLAPVWMDEAMSILDPNIWGPYETLLRANYEEYLGRGTDEYAADLAAFVERYQDYLITLKPGKVCASQAEENRLLAGRLEHRLTTAHNRTLTIPFNRNLDTRTDTYHPGVSDPTGATDVTKDVFDLTDADGQIRRSSSFEGASLADDGWFGTAGTLAHSSDVSVAAGGTKSLHIVDGFAARRLVLPDGRFILKFWVKTSGPYVQNTGRIDIVRNTRLRPKQVTRDIPTSRITSIEHFKESYETVASAVLRSTELETDTWRQVFVSFSLKDHFFVKNEGYPAHEVFIVFSAPDSGDVLFDALTLLTDVAGHEIKIINTATHARFPDLLLDHEKVVDLETAFRADTEYEGRERASAFLRFDGANTCCVAKHRQGYNLHPTGTNINAWFKVNSTEETKHKVLERRGSFNLFQKGSAYLPSYQASINGRRELGLNWGGTGGAGSAGFFNALIHPSVEYGPIPSRVTWADPTMTARYHQCLTLGGKQPREWFSGGATALAALGMNEIGNDKRLVIHASDPYLTTGKTEMSDSAPGATLWKYFEWHARRAFRELLPEAQVLKCATFTEFAKHITTGNVFLPVPMSTELLEIPASLGNYSPSPIAWHAAHPSRRFPISPCQWGVGASPYWPTSPIYGSPAVWLPAELSSTFDLDALFGLTPMFIDGRLTFDRWFNLDLNADASTVEVRVNGMLMAIAAGGTFNVALGKENSEDLWIATTNPDDTNTGAPISVWMFKITQAKLSEADIAAQLGAESINFNELQYNVWGQYLDFDNDGQFEWYQDDATDYGLHMEWVDAPASPDAIDRGFPSDLSKVYGKVVTSGADRIQIQPIVDRNYDVLDDHFDERYLQELIDAQVLGYSDGLVFWDFLTDRNDKYHSFSHRVFNPACNRYEDVTLAYKPWVQGLINGEFNSIKALTDTTPTLHDVSPSPAVTTSSPMKTYGDDDTELVLNGVKGWFGFNDLLGYRDSLELLDNEGMIFNYLQIEFRFRADRATLESHLRDFADNYGTIFADDYPGHRLSSV